MTAQILVVDDVPANVKLLEAKLISDYYKVITAVDGFEALEKAKKFKPDLILLDVMMPGMDGFETCMKLKTDPEIAHIPVVMVTALSEKSDRLKGLESGADDFITKPINDVSLFARVKSLIRIKTLLDELRLRNMTGIQMGIDSEQKSDFIADVTGAKILLVDDDSVQSKQVLAKLDEKYKTTLVEDPELALETAKNGDFDVIIVSTLLAGMDGLRLASYIKSQEETRHVPIIVFVDEDERHIMLKALEMGINDYLTVPVDKNEMAVRIRTQLHRKFYQDELKAQYQKSVSMALTDGLTGLYNRHYLNAHLGNMIKQATKSSKKLALIIMDMDHFKNVNDTYGHDAGDMVLKQLAAIITRAARATDLPARFGGEEFVMLMPETDPTSALGVANRMRELVEKTLFVIDDSRNTINLTVSIGIANLTGEGDTAEKFIKRADEALYIAKNSGRNNVKVAVGNVPTGW
ncbi:MAG: PleD family two-component system response regulator [Rickettsiales bacterium]